MFRYDCHIRSIAVIGGGIGGLGAALSLLHAGFDVDVDERAAAVSEVGAIQVLHVPEALSTLNKTRFHLPDGPEQRERDELMASGATDFAIKAVAWIYGHDASRIDAPAPR